MTDAHPSDQSRGHSLRIDHGLIGGHVEMQVPLSWKVALLAEQTSLGTPTVRTPEALWVEVAFQPDHAGTVIEQFGHWKVDHPTKVPYWAR